MTYHNFFLQDLGCTFQEGLCGFEIAGGQGFMFERVLGNGSDVGADHNGDQTGIFLYAQSGATDSIEVP